MRKLKSPVKARHDHWTSVSQNKISGTFWLPFNYSSPGVSYPSQISLSSFPHPLPQCLNLLPPSSLFPANSISQFLLQGLNTSLNSRGPRFHSGTYVEHLLFLKKKKKSPLLWLRATIPLALGPLIPPFPLQTHPAQAFVIRFLNFLALPPHHRRSHPAYSLPPKFQNPFLQLSRALLPPSQKLSLEPILSENPRIPSPQPPLRLPRAYPTRAPACRALPPGSPSPRPAEWRWPRRAAPSPDTRCSAVARRGPPGRSGSAAAEGRSRPRSFSRSRPRSAAQGGSRSRSRPPPGPGPPAAAAAATAPGAGAPAPVRGGQRPWPNPPTQQKPWSPCPLSGAPRPHAQPLGPRGQLRRPVRPASPVPGPPGRSARRGP